MLLLRYGLAPGTGGGRPLGVTEDGLWEVTDGYPGTDWKMPPPAGGR